MCCLIGAVNNIHRGVGDIQSTTQKQQQQQRLNSMEFERIAERLAPKQTNHSNSNAQPHKPVQSTQLTTI